MTTDRHLSRAEVAAIMAHARELSSTVRERLPADFALHEELGHGSNNRVYRVNWKGKSCVLRVPRRSSDTTRLGNAKWEYVHTAVASVLEVAPQLHDAWFARHADDKWPAGLYLVMDYYPSDLEDAINDMTRRRQLINKREGVEAAIATALHRLAMNHLFVYDLKPSNIVLDLDGGPPRIRIIDYGREFCEWGAKAATQECDANSPVVDMLRRRLVAETCSTTSLTQGEHEEETAMCDARLVHVLFAAMLLQLAATTTRHIRSDRRVHRLDTASRQQVNVVAPLAHRLLDSMQGRHKQLVRYVLRADSVRSVLQHYHGRRNCGTKRTFQLATAQPSVA